MRKIRRHTWLFSFTDIAFLLLMVFTQLSQLNTDKTTVAEMRLPAPVVVKNPDLAARKPAPDYRQVLVEKHSERPFRMTHVIAGSETARSAPLSLDELTASLRSAFTEKKAEPRPVVVPLPESFSSDLLQATAVVGSIWNEGGSAVVHTGPVEAKP